MTEQEIELVAHNISVLFEHECLNQASFDLACAHLNWPNKSEFDMTSPYISKFIFLSMVAKANLNQPPECHLSHYGKLLEAFKRLSGFDDEHLFDAGWAPPFPNLITQQRLDQCIKHSSAADDLARIISRLDHAALLTPANEAFALNYLSKMGDSMFGTLTYQLCSISQKETIAIWQQAKHQFQWALNREQTVKQRQASNLEKITANKQLFEKQYADHQTQPNDLTFFKTEYQKYQNKEKLFNIIESYVKDGYFFAEQLHSLHSYMIHFIEHDSSKNLRTALSAGLVTFDELNALCHWSEAHRTYNDDYLRVLLSDDCVKLLQLGLFSVEDIHAFESHHYLRGYIEKQIEDSISVNKAATTIQGLVRGYSSRRQSRLFKDASIAKMELEFRQAAGAGNLKTCRQLLGNKSFSVNAQGAGSGKTALHWAAANGHDKIVDFLLEQKASLIKDSKGMTAYDVTNTPAIRRLLASHFKLSHSSTADMELQFRQAAGRGDVDTCQQLLASQSFSVDAQGAGSGKTALHWAAENGHVDIVYLLLENNASFLEDHLQRTPYDVTNTPEIRRLLTYHFTAYFRENCVTHHVQLTEEEEVYYGFRLTDEVRQDFWQVLQEKKLLPFHEMLKRHKLTVTVTLTVFL